MPAKKPRVNKTKAELLQELERQAKIQREISLCKLFWPFVGELDSIYDAQTAVNALAGFISYEVRKKSDELKVQDLAIDLTKEPESKIKDAVLALQGLIGPENAVTTASLLDRFGKTLAQYSAAQFMKKPMKDLKVEDIIA